MFLAFALVSSNGASKVLAPRTAYDLGRKSGLLDRGKGFHRQGVHVCSQADMEGKPELPPAVAPFTKQNLGNGPIKLHLPGLNPISENH